MVTNSNLHNGKVEIEYGERDSLDFNPPDLSQMKINVSFLKSPSHSKERPESKLENSINASQFAAKIDSFIQNDGKKFVNS